MNRLILLTTLFITTLLSAQTKQKFLLSGDSNLSEIVNAQKLKVTIVGDGTVRTIGKPFVTKNFVIGDGRVVDYKF
ncbi:MAG: hypothetical protein ACJ0P4_12620 [Flavobacteriaceae bacterium]